MITLRARLDSAFIVRRKRSPFVEEYRAQITLSVGDDAACVEILTDWRHRLPDVEADLRELGEELTEACMARFIEQGV